MPSIILFGIVSKITIVIVFDDYFPVKTGFRMTIDG